MPSIYARLVTTGSTVVKKGAPGSQVRIKLTTVSATATSTLTFTDGTTSYVIDVGVGAQKLHQSLFFAPDADVTITASGGTVSLFGENQTA